MMTKSRVEAAEPKPMFWKIDCSAAGRRTDMLMVLMLFEVST